MIFKMQPNAILAWPIFYHCKKWVLHVFCTGKLWGGVFMYSSSEVVLRTMKHTMIYDGFGPSSDVIALHPVV
jgi:hypothetical protein